MPCLRQTQLFLSHQIRPGRHLPWKKRMGVAAQATYGIVLPNPTRMETTAMAMMRIIVLRA